MARRESTEESNLVDPVESFMVRGCGRDDLDVVKFLVLTQALIQQIHGRLINGVSVSAGLIHLTGKYITPLLKGRLLLHQFE